MGELPGWWVPPRGRGGTLLDVWAEGAAAAAPCPPCPPRPRWRRGPGAGSLLTGLCSRAQASCPTSHFPQPSASRAPGTGTWDSSLRPETLCRFAFRQDGLSGKALRGPRICPTARGAAPAHEKGLLNQGGGVPGGPCGLARRLSAAWPLSPRAAGGISQCPESGRASDGLVATTWARRDQDARTAAVGRGGAGEVALRAGGKEPGSQWQRLDRALQEAPKLAAPMALYPRWRVSAPP